MNRFRQFPNCTEFVLAKEAEIQLVIRRHWLVDVLLFLKWFFWGPVIFSLTLLLLPFLKISVLSDTYLIITIGGILYLLSTTFYFFIDWLNHIYDIIFLTNDRVIDITQIDFWHRNISETRLDHVQDATGDVKGVISTVLDLGHIKIRTSNDLADFSINTVQHPHKKAREVFRLANIARREEIAGEQTKDGNFCPVNFTDHPSWQKKIITHEKVKNIQKKLQYNVKKYRGKFSRFKEVIFSKMRKNHKIPPPIPQEKNQKTTVQNHHKHPLSCDDIKKSMRHDLNNVMRKKK